ncbi:hypothetical protein GQ43DRAFT_447247 [Delitschia confertaspora ATCC 74209]|uniref:S-adenosyl-L-methionine-dependent methyltransferase n=1 Tax=Delitschia confertaspora ATCC 74209 TaxID=1513339 RepID=A0A9P4JQS7_9PLEO|nr:hypothetical protein GQ43DRAFT_447247 [Delitschia confertaspora ATCC 74209]
MPRLPTSLLRRAASENPLLPLLLRQCRDLRSAQNELRWLQEHAIERAQAQTHPSEYNGRVRIGYRTLLRDMVSQRTKGVPLQYILGTEHFGELELGVRRGVLIPRQETASVTTHLAHLLSRSRFPLPPELRILDLCTGSGCIPLLFQHEFRNSALRKNKNKDVKLKLLGVDISSTAIALANSNLQHVMKESRSLLGYPDNTGGGGDEISFLQADILPTPNSDTLSHPQNIPAPLLQSLDLLPTGHGRKWDILISNPPYISPKFFSSLTTERSVRKWEPKLALVPPKPKPAGSTVGKDTDDEQADLFYPVLLDLADRTGAKICLFEVADLAQASRVVRLVRERGTGLGRGWDRVEVWRDEPGLPSEPEEVMEREEKEKDEASIETVGRGNGRAVVCWRGAGGLWLGKETNKALD